MKARAYAQITVDRDSSGFARGASVRKVTQRYPYSLLPGALIVHLVLDLPDSLANVQTMEGAIEAGMMTLVLEPEEPA